MPERRRVGETETAAAAPEKNTINRINRIKRICRIRPTQKRKDFFSISASASLKKKHEKRAKSTPQYIQ
jgi:hypothetical protein